MVNENNILLQWVFPEFEKHERTKRWWALFIIIDIIVFLYAVFLANFLFALIIIMITGIIVFRHYHEPEEINFSITASGIELSERTYLWSEFESFWLVYEPPEVKNLYLSFKSKIKSPLAIPLAKQNPVKIREILSDYLEEDLDKESEPTMEALGRMLKI